ncbi:chlorophyll synthesis pathway protein BchC [Leptolyngbya sp. 15MV]|nr:chlorophyll synthesis pathway protein BchC [Leptolyngbya sp. 15MV]
MAWSMESLAVILEAPRQLSLRRLSLTPLGASDVVVDIHWSGISSGTEKLLWSGEMPPFPGMGYPLVPGYESVGRVVDAGAEVAGRIGEWVFVPGANCYTDARGLFGGTAQRLIVPSARALPIAESLGKDGVLFALAATALHAMQGGDPPDLIVGHGVLGRLLARLTVASGAPAPTVWETNPQRHGGASGYAVVSPDDDDRRDYRSIYDVSGDAANIDTLVGRLAKKGEIVLAGFYADRPSFAFPPAFRAEARFRVAAEWGPDDLASTRALIESGALDLGGLVSDVRPAEEAESAYPAAFGDPACLKMAGLSVRAASARAMRLEAQCAARHRQRLGAETRRHRMHGGAGASVGVLHPRCPATRGAGRAQFGEGDQIRRRLPGGIPPCGGDAGVMKAPLRRAGFLDLPDCRLAYEVTGEGPAIVFAHGLGGNLMSWWQQVAHFAPRHRCVSFSHRGFFPSSVPDGGPDPAKYAADLAALVDHLALGDVRIVCQSMGGWTGVEYALLRPGRVKALVLGATIGTLDPRAVAGAETGRDTAAARVDLLARGINPAAGARMAEEQPALHHLYNHIYNLSAGFDREAVRRKLYAMRIRPPSDFAAAQCPVLFIPSEEDVVLAYSGAAMAAATPNARAATLRKAGHSGHFERAREFNALVEAFFEDVGA